MLRFFRQIRQRLLTDNKFSKYLLYAVGEILLVVIGILIALQVDNWNEDRQEADKIKAQLTSLLRDLREDRGGLEQLRSFHSFRVHAAYYLLDQYNGTEKIVLYPETGPLPKLDEEGLFGGKIPDSYDKDFVVRAFSWLVRSNFINPNTVAIEEFKSTGLFALFENDEIKNRITRYYRGFAFAFPPAEITGDANSVLLKSSLVSNGYSFLDITLLEDPVQELLSIPTNEALLKNIVDDSTFRSNRASSVLDELDQLTEMIEKEINKNPSG